MIEVKNVWKSFPNQPVLKGISFELGKAETVIIQGISGCGKTTFLRLLAGLDYPDQGEIRFDELLMSKPDFIAEPSRRKLAFVFQQPALWPHMKVSQIIRFGMKGERSQQHDLLNELASGCNIERLMGKYPSELSMGEQRRVSLARALASQPDYLLLDEALVNLDKQNQANLAGLIKNTQENIGFGIIHVSHHDQDQKAISGRILIMEDGILMEKTNGDES